MSETRSPVSVVFDVQRTALEQTHEAVKRGIETQREFTTAAVDFGPAKRANEDAYEAVHTGIDAYFDALEAVFPGQTAALDDLRATIDEQLDSFEATQSEFLDDVEKNVQENTESTDELLDEFAATIDEQFEAILSAHEATEDTAVDATAEFETMFDELRTEFEQQRDAASEDVEAQFDEFEAQLESLQAQLEDATENLTETVEQQVEAQIEAAEESLEALDGLGPTYASRLREAGFDTLEALADANAEAVATAAEVSEKQAEQWIDAAESWN